MYISISFQKTDNSDNPTSFCSDIELGAHQIVK